MAAGSGQLGGLVQERRISGKAFTGHYVVAVVAGLVLAAVLMMTPLAVFSPLGALPVLGVWAFAQLSRLSSSYCLYTDRLEIESGLLNRKIENIDLFRVRDVGLRQGLFGRIANFGDVYLHSTDSSTPDLHVRGIDAPKEFYQQLRQLVSESRAAARTMIVEEGRTIAEP
jgi:uncharacterized membrane protein YdbT with pleckstrin-like domain